MTTLGTCPACHRQYTLTKEGLLPLHLEKAASGRKTSPPCAGSDKQPTTEK